MQVTSVSELDLSLIHALEVNPRASWARIGEILGVAPGTAARRWSRLSAVGAAWVAVLPGALSLTASAQVMVNCVAGRKYEVARTIALDAQAFTVEITGGSSDLVVTVVTETIDDVRRYVLERLDTIPGVTSTRTAIATDWFSEGTQWRIGALSKAQEHEAARDTDRATANVVDYTEVDRALIRALSMDGRSSGNAIGERIGRDATTVTRRLQRLLARGLLSLRCELASTLSGWPMHASLQLSIPPGELRSVGRAVVTWPEVRMSLAVAAEANLIVSVWLRRPSDLIAFETRFSQAFPSALVRDRRLDLQVVKRVGHVLDGQGYSTRIVPCAVWA